MKDEALTLPCSSILRIKNNRMKEQYCTRFFQLFEFLVFQSIFSYYNVALHITANTSDWQRTVGGIHFLLA